MAEDKKFVIVKDAKGFAALKIVREAAPEAKKAAPAPEKK